MAEVKRVTFGSLLVALDGSVHSLWVLQQAAALAGQLRIGLQALVIEDESLLRLAELPFAREVSRKSGIERTLDAVQLKRALRARSSQFQQVIDRVAAGGQISANLRVVRGHYLAEALSATTSTDLLLLGSAGQGFTIAARQQHDSGAKTRSTATMALYRSTRKSTCTVLYTGTDTAARALDMAVKLIDAPPSLSSSQSPAPLLTVLIASHTVEDAARLREQASKILAATPRPHQLIDVRVTNAVDIIRYLRRSGCAMLVIPRSDGEVLLPQVSGLLHELDCPLVLVG